MARTRPSLTIALVFVLLLSIFAASDVRAEKLSVNLVPDTPAKTPSYWCTWGAQNYAADDAAFDASVWMTGHFPEAEVLTEKYVFEDPGWANFLPKVKKDLYILFDLGWDTPAGVKFDHERWRLGTLELEEKKFPSCTGTPAQRLRKLNDLTKAAGWRGAGIWLASQVPGDGKDSKKSSLKEAEKYFRERAKWSKEAGIEYWKVDYGAQGGDPEFRKVITRVAAEEAPGMVVEHGRGAGPLNDQPCPWESEICNYKGSYRTWGDGNILNQAVEQAKFSDILRTYDVTAYLSVPTTLDRVASILAEFSGKSQYSCILNCEDEPYIAAALGCATGILRHPLCRPEPENIEYDPFDNRLRIDQVTRAVRWHRIAPAFGVGKTQNLLDENLHVDTWRFRPGDSWATWMAGKETFQTAPARVSRGIPLPEVDSGRGPAPYVIASQNPNGAIAVATLPRISTGSGIYYPLADVSIEIGYASAPIGIFGKYKSLTLNTCIDLQSCKILAQDLAGDSACDITDKVKIEDKKITVPGHLIERIGLSAKTPGDLSDPGLVLVIKK